MPFLDCVQGNAQGATHNRGGVNFYVETRPGLGATHKSHVTKEGRPSKGASSKITPARDPKQ